MATPSSAATERVATPSSAATEEGGDAIFGGDGEGGDAVFGGDGEGLHLQRDTPNHTHQTPPRGESTPPPSSAATGRGDTPPLTLVPSYSSPLGRGGDAVFGGDGEGLHLQRDTRPITRTRPHREVKAHRRRHRRRPTTPLRRGDYPGRSCGAAICATARGPGAGP